MTHLLVKPIGRYYYIQILIAVLILIVAIYGIGSMLDMDNLSWMLFPVIGGIILGAIAYITVKVQSVEIAEHDVILITGLISTKRVVVPYNHITNINIKRNPIERILKIGTLEIDTSGTDKVELRMPNIKKHDLYAVVDEFRKMKQRVKE